MRAAAEQARAEGFEDQYAVLSDGVVTESEYADAVDRGRACMRSAGLEVTELMMNPVDGLMLTYAIEPNGQESSVANEASLTCQSEQIYFVEQQYLATHEPHMDPPLYAASVECLQNAGFDLTGAESGFGDFVDSAGPDTENQVADCISAAAREVYPPDMQWELVFNS